MPGQTEAEVVALELERVRENLSVAFECDFAFWSQVKKKNVEVVSNRQMRVPIALRPGGKTAAYNPDFGDLGRGSGRTYDKAVVSPAHLRHAIEWSQMTDIVTDSKRKAILSSTRDSIATALDEFSRTIDSLAMSAGDGVLATATSVAIGTGTGGGDILTCTGDGFGVRLLRDNHDVNIYNSTLTTNRTLGAERTINFYDGPNKIVHITPSLATLTAGDKVVLSGLTATPPVHLLGVPYHHTNSSSGTWLGFSRSTTPQIRANRVAAGGALSLPFPRLALNKIGDRLGKDKRTGTKAWMHPCQKQSYEEMGQLISIINKTSKNEKLDLYFGDEMQMAGAPVVESFSWDKTRIDFVNIELWGRAELNPIDWYKGEDGRKIFELRGSSGGVMAGNISYMVCSFQFFHTNPAGAAYIDTLAVPTGY